MKKLKKEIVTLDCDEQMEITQSSGNVFADLELPDAEELQLKSSLVIQIKRFMNDKHMTQTQLAKLVGLDQPRISKLLRGHLNEFSVERLMFIVNRLGRRVEVRISEREYSSAEAKTVVLVG